MITDDKIMRAVKAIAKELEDKEGNIKHEDIEEVIRVLKGTIES